MGVFTQREDMNDVRTRLAVVAVLAAVGVGLAGAGAVLGAGDAIAGGDRMGEVTVAGTNVTVSGSDGEVVLTGNVSETSDVEIIEAGGGITVAQRENEPFTRQERERAIEITRSNETIAAYLETVEDVAFRVEPVEKIDADEMQTATVEFDVNGTTGTIASGENVRVANVTVEEQDYSVTIDREPSYVAGRAVVRIHGSDGDDPDYSADVDLANGTVADVTDWTGV
jgi:flagellar basal body P-ring protein FlgI